MVKFHQIFRDWKLFLKDRVEYTGVRVRVNP